MHTFPNLYIQPCLGLLFLPSLISFPFIGTGNWKCTVFVSNLLCVFSLCKMSYYFRFVVLTTSGGIMDHEEARRKHLGGKILGFFF
jgi:hypothetical protein